MLKPTTISFFRVESAEQAVETQDNDKASMLTDLQHTKTELDACVDCLEEAIARVTNTPRSTGIVDDNAGNWVRKK